MVQFVDLDDGYGNLDRFYSNIFLLILVSHLEHNHFHPASNNTKTEMKNFVIKSIVKSVCVCACVFEKEFPIA